MQRPNPWGLRALAIVFTLILAGITVTTALITLSGSFWAIRLATATVTIVGVIFTVIGVLVTIATFMSDLSPARSSQEVPQSLWQEFTSGEFRVTSDSLHWHLYKWYRHHREDTWKEHRPNFCMYFWTIAIGVPVLWFFVVPFYKFIRPWMVVVAAAAISGGVLSYIIWPHTSLHILVITLIFVVAIAGCVGIAVGLSELDERVSEQRKRRLGKTVAYATVLLWIVPLYLVLGLLVLVDEVIDPYWREWMAWFFKSRVAKVVYPWSVTLAGLLIGSWALLGTSTWVLVMVRIGVVIGAVAAFVLAAALVVLLVVGLKWVWQHIPWPSVSTAARPVKPVVDRGSSTASLYAHGLKAKKRRVCPRIQFPESL